MRLLLVVALVVGCSSTRNPETCLQGLCPDPSLPFCDVDGSLSGEPNTCIAVDCTPNAFQECRDDRALSCNATGDNYEIVACEYGCDAGGCIRCDRPECEKRIIPKYAPTTCSELSSDSLDITQNKTIDTSDASMCTAIVQQSNGLEICLLKYREISIRPNQTLRVVGSRAFALVADYALKVDGTIDASATGTISGPGVTLKSGSTSTSAGGGGAGYRTAGGAGASTTASGGAANGGPPGEKPMGLSDLFGGRVANQVGGTQAPGGAGGALTIIACRGKLSVSGMIDAGGGGGLAGFDSITPISYRHPTGGGSGGTIVLQGMQVEITGLIFANGGGGGGGGPSVLVETGSTPSSNGQDGQPSTNPALGGFGYNGVTSGPTGGNGGKGGTGAAPSFGDVAASPGAGGGAAGFIVVYTPDNIQPTLTPVIVSPAIEPRQVIETN